jgi:glycosyltransferase involved in cell wall biosynthesis
VRIVFVDPRGDFRAYEHGLAAALVRRGHVAAIITSRFLQGDLPAAPGVRIDERFYVLARACPMPLRRLARGLEHPFDLALVVASLILRPPDVVHVQALPLPAFDRVAWRVARRLVRARFVYTAHNAVPKHGVGSATQVRLDANVFDRVIVHTAAGEESLVALGVPRGNVRRVTHGALTGYADVVATRPERVPDGVPVAAFLGLIRPYKGLGVLLDAWQAVRARVPDAVLLVHGRPLGGDEDAARARTLDEAGAGVVADLTYASAAAFAGVLRRADVLVLPYRSIDQSGILLSALALGTPVVVTDVGGLREVVEVADAGVVVPPDDPAALGEAIISLLADPDRRARLGRNGRAAAAGAYSWARAAARSEEIYRGG